MSRCVFVYVDHDRKIHHHALLSGINGAFEYLDVMDAVGINIEPCAYGVEQFLLNIGRSGINA